MTERPAGWYVDPWTDGQYRYWTGTSWTADVFPHGAPGQAWAPPAEAPGPPPSQPSPVQPLPPAWGAPESVSATEVLAAEPWTPAPPAGRGQRRGLLFVVLMLLAGLVVGFLGVLGVQQLTGRQSAATAPNPGGAPALPTQPAPAVDPAAAVLPNLVVRQSDVGSTVTVAQLHGGNSVSGAATLDLCNGTFPSEALRTARLQVAAYNSQGAALLSTEAVAYRNAAATAQAFAELRSVVASCPRTPVTSPVGEPTVTTVFGPAPDASWPRTAGVDRQAYAFTTTDASGTSGRSMAVYLKRGRILLGVYFPQAARPQAPVAGQTTPAAIVKVFQDRLAALPVSATGTG